MKLTTRQKADAGLWLLEEAILEVIRGSGPMRPSEVRDALGWPEWGGGVAVGVMAALTANNLLAPDGAQPHPRYSIVPGSTH